ncbi:unnamed protein product [Nyctereutes procyonoides]|uniref:(raccoon dog) hypothetical protein n=1 Tax=Nyctereutes procyonoides TaxID=34880 RepID=A0A811YIQ8_NYCPR|nr:unnamed protein product [Nyctereutes procyonoides]
MYNPLTKANEVKFLSLKDHDPGEVNKACEHFCAMMMDCVIERAFEDEYVLSLLRAPAVPVISGAFCYDVVLDKELELPFETLEVEAKDKIDFMEEKLSQTPERNGPLIPRTNVCFWFEESAIVKPLSQDKLLKISRKMERSVMTAVLRGNAKHSSGCMPMRSLS